MTRESEFLVSIAESPDDDELRLVFSDWLEDHGKPYWAEIIRLQVRCTKADPDGLDRPWPSFPSLLRHTSIEDIERLRKEMGYPVPFEAWGVQRGFVRWLAMKTSDFLAYADAIVEWGPLPTLRLDEVKAHLDELIACPALARVQSLCLDNAKLWDDDLGKLLSSPNLTGLRELNLGGLGFFANQDANSITAEGIRHLATARTIPNLERLGLSRNPIGDDGLEILSSGVVSRQLKHLVLEHCHISGSSSDSISDSAWPVLEYLGLTGNRLTAEGSERLARSPILGPALRSLMLSWSGFTDRATQILASSPTLGALRRLELIGNPIGDDGFLSLARCPALTQLRQLRMRPKKYRDGERVFHVSQRGGSAFAEATWQHSLRVLELGGHRVGDSGLVALANSGGYAELEVLNLANNEIGDSGVVALTRAEHIDHIEHLTLSSNRIGAEGARALADWPGLLRLKIEGLGRNPYGPNGVDWSIRYACRELGDNPVKRIALNLEEMELGDFGVARLVRAPELVNVSTLRLMDNGITARGAELLAECPSLANVVELELGINPIGDEGVVALANSPHLARLRTLSLGTTKMTDDGVRSIVASSNLKQLRELILFGNPLTSSVGRILCRADWPDLEKIHLDAKVLDDAARVTLLDHFGSEKLRYY